ncbi:MAG TPA: hypothetical protein VN704_01715, partial [Verrucomicrobiae bacterium]|nr:hypothetical protein [Verrucomicrobiae bacterium]
MLEDSRIVTVLQDAQTRRDAADHRRQYDPKFKGHACGADPSGVIRLRKGKKEYAISSRDSFWKRNEKITHIPVPANDMLCAALDCQAVFTMTMESCKIYTLNQMSHMLYKV